MYREFVEKNIKQQQLNTFIKKSGSAIIQELLNAEEFPGFETFIEKELIGMDKDVEFSEPSLLRRGLYYSQVKSMDPKINTFLSEYYKSDTEKLFSLIGHKLNW